MQLLGDKYVVCVHLYACVHALMCLFVFADLEKLLYSLTARLQTVYRLVLAWCMCLRQSYLTNPYIISFITFGIF